MSRGDIFLYQGDLVGAEREYRKLRDLQGDRPRRRYLYRMASLYTLQGRLTAARALMEQGIREWETRGEKWIARGMRSWLADILRQSGDLERALREYDQIWAGAAEEDDVSGQAAVLQARCVVYLGLSEPDRALKMAAALEDLVRRRSVPTEMRRYHYAVGRVELHRANTARAIELFEKALTGVASHWEMHALFRSALASAYYEAGDLERAREEYERVVSAPGGRVVYGDVVADALCMLGRINERLGRTEEARRSYRAYLSLRGGADPGITEVKEARERLAALERT